MMRVGSGELLLLGVVALVMLAFFAGLVLFMKYALRNRSTQAPCPKCGRALTRAPEKPGQVMWSGWRCEGCNTELDKWGRIVGD